MVPNDGGLGFLWFSTNMSSYRLRVNVNWFAIISYGNKTANIYVKKLYSLYKLCKGDIVVGDIKL